MSLLITSPNNPSPDRASPHITAGATGDRLSPAEKIPSTTGGYPSSSTPISASRLRSNLRESDTVARLGGDEFVVLLANAGEVAAAAIAGKLKSRAETAVAAIGLPVTLSIGQITFSRAADVEALTREVDAAMYRAKRAGKNRIVQATAAGTD